MTRRAMLIGSQTYGLQGCNADVALMQRVLAGRGFDSIDVRTDTTATRAGILDGFEALIGSIARGDAVAIYYSGHGGRVVRPDFEARKAIGASVHFQFIVPTDMEDSDVGDFRGITSEELTIFQRRLTEAFDTIGEVPNVTTILDCCHSGFLARDVGATRKSIDGEEKSFRLRGIREHIAALGPQADLIGTITNPAVVRIVACQPEQSAFELPSTRGGRHGALTDAIATVLDGLGPAPVPWGVVGDLVRRRVRALVPEQRPDVEGPGERVVFSSESAPERTAMAVNPVGNPRDGKIGIEAAALLGIAVGDEFDLIVAGQSEPAGTAVVSALEAGNAVLQPSSPAATAAVAQGVVAVPRRISVPKALVRLDVTGTGADALAAAITASTRLGLTTDVTDALATVATEPSGFFVVDRAGARWRATSFTDSAAGHAELLKVLEELAVGHRLIDLPSGDGESALPPVVELELGVVENGSHRAVAAHGERLTAGTHVYLSIRNTGNDPLFAWVFDVGVSGRSSLVTDTARSGTELGPKGSEDEAISVWEAAGAPLFWPKDVPTTPSAAGTDAARPETFVVLVADRRSDLSPLASSPATARGVGESPLEAIVAEARTGVREVPPNVSGEPPLRYRLDTVDFLLLPS